MARDRNYEIDDLVDLSVDRCRSVVLDIVRPVLDDIPEEITVDIFREVENELHVRLLSTSLPG